MFCTCDMCTEADHKALLDDTAIKITHGQAAEILSVHSQLQEELAEQDRTIKLLRKTIEDLEAERESWQEPTQLSADVY